VDSSKATSCYSNWRIARSLSNNTSDLSQVITTSPAPQGYRLVSEAEVDCFCGSLEIEWDRIRIPMTSPTSTSITQEKQLYVVELTDGVNKDCVVVANTVCDPKDVASLVRMVRPLPSCYGPVFAVEIAE